MRQALATINCKEWSKHVLQAQALLNMTKLEPKKMVTPDEFRAGTWFDANQGIKTTWEPTPKWMFWKPTMRRIVVPPAHHHGTRRLSSLYEYQHPAFVAREALENYCAPRTVAREKTRIENYNDSDTLKLDRIGRSHPSDWVPSR